MILSYAVPELWPGIQIPSCEPMGGDNAHVVVDQPSSVKARQFKFSWKDIFKFIFTKC